MTTSDLFDPDVPIEARNGRRYPYASLGHWVLLRPELSDRAIRLYALLRMCADRSSEECHPGQLYLCELMAIGGGKTEKVTAAARELVELGAVDIRTVRAKRGRLNIYTVHEAPPEDYPGARTQTEYAVLTGKIDPPEGYRGPLPSGA